MPTHKHVYLYTKKYTYPVVLSRVIQRHCLAQQVGQRVSQLSCSDQETSCPDQRHPNQEVMMLAAAVVVAEVQKRVWLREAVRVVEGE